MLNASSPLETLQEVVNIAPDDAFRFWSSANMDGPTPIHRPELGPCWVWRGGLNQHGYGRISINGIRVLSHRVAWLLIHNRLPSPFALHKCDNPACVRPTHLFEGTQADNMLDARDKKRASAPPTFLGERHPMAILTDDQVREIRARKTNIVAMAKEFGVSWSNIKAIRRRHIWAHVL